MKHLRIVLPLLLFVTSNFAFGSSYGGAKGTNRLGQEVGFASEELNQVWVHDPKQGKDHFTKYEMSIECPAIIEWLDSPPKKGLLIHCSAVGRSPLAGATYTKVKSKRIMNGCENPATVFKCVAGCERKEVPHIIVEQPWEC